MEVELRVFRSRDFNGLVALCSPCVQGCRACLKQQVRLSLHRPHAPPRWVFRSLSQRFSFRHSCYSASSRCSPRWFCPVWAALQPSGRWQWCSFRLCCWLVGAMRFFPISLLGDATGRARASDIVGRGDQLRRYHCPQAQELMAVRHGPRRAASPESQLPSRAEFRHVRYRQNGRREALLNAPRGQRPDEQARQVWPMILRLVRRHR